MNIYRLRVDANRFQSFFVDDEAWSLEDGSFDGKHRLESWSDPGMYVLHPKHKKGNFFGFGSAAGTFIADVKASKELADLFEMSGELMPFSYKGEVFHVVNVTEVIDVLDEDRTQWVHEKGSGLVKSYAFHANRLTETPLFKIPQENSVYIFTVEGLKDPDDEFKGRVEQSGLSGLVFQKVWSSEEG